MSETSGVKPKELEALQTPIAALGAWVLKKRRLKLNSNFIRQLSSLDLAEIKNTINNHESDKIIELFSRSHYGSSALHFALLNDDMSVIKFNSTHLAPGVAGCKWLWHPFISWILIIGIWGMHLPL